MWTLILSLVVMNTSEQKLRSEGTGPSASHQGIALFVAGTGVLSSSYAEIFEFMLL